MAGRTKLRCTALKIVVTLPWWPTDVSRTLSSRNVNELERAGKRPLAVPTSLTTDDYSIGYVLRTERWRDASYGGFSVTEHLRDLEKIAKAKAPVQLEFGDNAEGLWRIEAPSITILEWDENTDRPSVVDVSLTLKRASDAIVNVGLVKRIKGRGRQNMRNG